jgi:hypothetical protein
MWQLHTYLVLQTKGPISNTAGDNIGSFPSKLKLAYSVGILHSLQDEISHLNVLERYLLVSPFFGFFLVFQQILDCIKPVDLH